MSKILPMTAIDYIVVRSSLSLLGEAVTARWAGIGLIVGVFLVSRT